MYAAIMGMVNPILAQPYIDPLGYSIIGNLYFCLCGPSFVVIWEFPKIGDPNIVP